MLGSQNDLVLCKELNKYLFVLITFKFGGKTVALPLLVACQGACRAVEFHSIPSCLATPTSSEGWERLHLSSDDRGYACEPEVALFVHKGTVYGTKLTPFSSKSRDIIVRGDHRSAPPYNCPPHDGPT